jgi:hypothetical protein
MDVMTRRLPPRRRDHAMTESIPQEEIKGTSEPPPAKKAPVAKRRPHAAPTKAKRARKAAHAKKAAPVRAGTKTAKVIHLLKRPGGATLKNLMKATGWQAPSVRGFLSGTLGKKLKSPVASFKSDTGERAYRLPSK